MEWNQPLPSDFQTKFVSWRETFTALGGVNVPRTYDSLVSAVGSPKDLLVFKDASKKTIAADGDNGKSQFSNGKAKMVPKHGHTIPRFDLLNAVTGIKIYRTILEELDSLASYQP